MASCFPYCRPLLPDIIDPVNRPPQFGLAHPKMLHGGDEGIGRGLSKSANRRVAHGLGEFGQQFRVPSSRSSSATALSQPTRHGVHWPQRP